MNSLPESLTVFFSWLGRASIQAGILVLIILVLQMLLRDCMPPRWRYGLWLLLIVRLALPWAPSSPASIYNWLPNTSGSVRSDSVFMTQVGDHSISMPTGIIGGQIESKEIIEAQSSIEPAVSIQAEPSSQGTRRSSIQSSHLISWLVAGLWLAGALTLALLATIQSHSFGSSIRRRRLVTDEATLSLLEDCKREMEVFTHLPVLEVQEIKSPALLGFIRPRLLLPEGSVEQLGAERLRHVFLHELAHLKRHDVLVNWLMTLLQTLHWFNPLVWYGFSRIRAERELAADALVLSRTQPKEAWEYGQTIVHFLENYSRPQRLPGLAGVMEDKSQIKRRITMIAKFKKSGLGWSIAAALLMVTIGCVTLTNAGDMQRGPKIGRASCRERVCMFV